MLKLVTINGLREAIFEEGSRPSIRWIKYKKAAGILPFIKIGRRVWFDPAVVRAALLAAQQTAEVPPDNGGAK